MKQKISILSLVLVLSMLLAACGQNSNGGDTPAVKEAFEGSSAEVLTQVLEAVNMEMMTFEDPVSAETSQGFLGLTSEEFGELVTDATISAGAITTNAHQIVVIKATSPENASKVKELVAAGFDSGRWICVRPEQSAVVEAGSYVLLVVSSADTVSQTLSAWSELAGDIAGEANTFYG